MQQRSCLLDRNFSAGTMGACMYCKHSYPLKRFISCQDHVAAKTVIDVLILDGIADASTAPTIKKAQP
jgi:hypothetical protein